MKDLLFGIAVLLFLAAIGGIVRPYLPNWPRKQFAMVAGVAFLAMLVIVPPPPNERRITNDSVADRDPIEAGGSSETNKQIAVAAPVRPDAEYARQLEREVRALRQTPRMIDISEDGAGVMMGIVLIGARAQLIRDAPAQKSPDTLRLEAEYRRLQTAFQRDLFPRLRRVQVRIWNRALWESNIEVASLGARAETVRFTGGIFASNRNIASAHETALETLRTLRFGRDSYEWYRGSRGWNYDLEPLSDGDLAVLSSNGQWMQVR